MQNADNFAKIIEDDCYTPFSEYFQGHSDFDLTECIALIRARDMEIVEACKEAINAKCEMRTEVGICEILASLDSVLRDLG